MFNKTKLLAKSVFNREHDLTAEDVHEARVHIASYWEKLRRFHPKDDENLVGLPKPYIVPAYEEGHEFDFNELYYWDSYFITQGLLDNKHKQLVLGVLDDLVDLFRHFKIIPNASRVYLTGRSQPPLLTSFIFDVYDTYELDIQWLQKMIKVAEDEYHTVWMGTTKPNARQVYRGLSRYYDINYLDDLAEAESGWDMTPRFNRKCLNYLPIDLNSLLYKYEMDFARYYKLMDDKKNTNKWIAAAKKRKDTITDLMWSNIRDMFFDYNFVKEKKGSVSSLAAFYTMWSGMATAQQARQLVGSLKRFEQKGGLSTTETQSLNKIVSSSVPTQWAYPNGWAPLHFMVVKGLQRYGYYEDARRIAMKWLRTNLDWYNQHGVFIEKYNVVSPNKPPAKGLYPSQTGFGWTNAIFERFCQEFIDAKVATIL